MKHLGCSRRHSSRKASCNWQNRDSSTGYELQIVLLHGGNTPESIPSLYTQSCCPLRPLGLFDCLGTHCGNEGVRLKCMKIQTENSYIRKKVIMHKRCHLYTASIVGINPSYHYPREQINKFALAPKGQYG